MMRSTGGEQLKAFEGLVHSTAHMFALQVGRDEDDLAQELRVRVWKAVQSYDSSKGGTLERYVFQAVTNKIKDYKRDAAREAKRRERYGISFSFIEDVSKFDDSAPDAFDSRHHFIERDEVYGEVDEGKFTLPAGVTEREANVLLLLMMELTKTEIAVRLRLTRVEVFEVIASLRLKFGDWQPSGSASATRELPSQRAAVAA